MVDGYAYQQDMIFAAGKYSMADQICYAEFLRYYYLICKSIYNENQPKELKDNLLEDNSFCSPVNYPKILPLMSSKEKIHCRRVSFILVYHVPNKYKYPEHIYCFCFINSRIKRLYCQNVMEHILVN